MAFKCISVFSQVFQAHVSSVSSFFRHMLQKFHLNVSKLDKVVYMLQCDSPATTTCCSYWSVVHACGKTGMECCTATGAGSGMGCRRLALECSSRGRPDAGVRPDVQALVLPYTY
jgi:hypothetical protein